MTTALRASIGALAASLALVVPVLAAPPPASAAIVINEVESQGGASDFVELFNTGAVAVDIGDYVLKDSGEGNNSTIPAGTMIQPSGFYSADVTGLGSADSARLFTPGAASLVDSYSWTAHAAATYGRCPDGTGAFVSTNSPTPGAANDCPVPGLTWPGGSSVSIVDDSNVFGPNLSGLAYQPSGTSARGVLWAVRNGPSTLYRLVYDGTKWTPDTANGWSAGKQLLYPDGDPSGGPAGVPDAEGVTLAGGDASGIFVSTERDDGPAGGVSRPAVLRFDVTSADTVLKATRVWDLTDLPGLGANAGLEAIAWVPDSLLVAKGFKDDASVTYDPASYPNHGTGLFFVGVEQDGRVIAYALNQSTGAFTRVAEIASGFPKIMDLEYEPETTHLWAVCDDSCNGQTKTLDIAQSGGSDGHFVVTNTYERPAASDNLNNEGFAIAPQKECVANLKPTFYSDDSNTGGHALRQGTLNCTVLPADSDPDPGSGSGDPGTTPGDTTPPPGGGPTGPPVVPPDLTAPPLKIALKLTKSGKFAVRRTGRFGAVITLGEQANLTITATARRSARTRARTILRTTRKGVAVGRRTLVLKLKASKRKSLRKGETVKLTVRARDAAGNLNTRRATAKVK